MKVYYSLERQRLSRAGPADGSLLATLHQQAAIIFALSVVTFKL